ncbi:hypothetical protein [Treponema zioleckii]|uniref:hypothetical protein n=1 Tax=Treponema zioleckii TaxID=331680 RepID=UPI00168B7720|nr:hypothetical protein [Treponema zioleckii]
MKASFENWTAYDIWLVQNYSQFDIIDVNEVDGKVEVEYLTKEEYAELKKTFEES